MNLRFKSAIYASIDWLSGRQGIQRRINGHLIRLPSQWARYYPAQYDSPTFGFIERSLRQGATAIDVGAHIGLFTVHMARLVGTSGRVISFEPSLETRQILDRVVQLNGCTSIVQTRPEAVSASTGASIFFETGLPGSVSNSLVGGTAFRQTSVPVTVPVTSIDDFIYALGGSVEFIKIDAEGSEFEVLQGAKRVITELRPYLSIGVHPEPLGRTGHSLADLWALMASYRLAVEHDGQFVDRKWFVHQENLFDIQVTPLEI